MAQSDTSRPVMPGQEGTKVFTTRSITDTAMIGYVSVQKDYRIELLTGKMQEYHKAISNVTRSGSGYRLMLLSTSDRNEAMRLRSQLLQLFPEQKVYMVFQSPFIKLKFGDFVERDEAVRYREQLKMQKLVAGNIYVLSEIVVIKPEILENPEN
ncbi:MAG: SPOR domain-containing protein [Ferruginibacter sp.]